MRAVRLIKPQYERILRALAGGYDPDKEQQPECVITENATMSECKRYAVYYLVGNSRSYRHYRYNRYYCFVDQVMGYYEVENSVFHLDLGCGPGLFTWVIRDYFLQNKSAGIKFGGYDHAPNMVELARKVWKTFGVEEKYKCYRSIDKVIAYAAKASKACGFTIVTFGHVLLQTCRNKAALDTFARIIATVAKSGKCIVIASDAHSGNRDISFQAACSHLKREIARRGYIIDMQFVDGESKMYGEIKAKV